MPEHQQTQQSTESKTTSQRQATPRIQAPSSHPMAIIQRARINPKSLTSADVLQLQQTIGNRAVGRLLSEIGLIPSRTKQTPPVQMQTIPEEEKEPLQGKITGTIQRQEPEEEENLQMKYVVQRQELPEDKELLQGKFESKIEQTACPSCIQRKELEEEEPLQTKRENNTGMPDNLKAGVESLSGIDMSDVRVHYNSDKPADVGALAYTQGTNIHVAPGQEKHLPHEAWHVVQQAQGRVKPTVQMKGVAINDDDGLEREADAMSTSATKYKSEIKLSYPMKKGDYSLSDQFSIIQMVRWVWDARKGVWTAPFVSSSTSRPPSFSGTTDGEEYDDEAQTKLLASSTDVPKMDDFFCEGEKGVKIKSELLKEIPKPQSSAPLTHLTGPFHDSWMRDKLLPKNRDSEHSLSEDEHPSVKVFLGDELYHYSSEEGARGIQESGAMYPSVKKGKPYTHFGKGVYYTDIGPDKLMKGTHGELCEAIYSKDSPQNRERCSRLVKVDVSDQLVLKYTLDGRHPVYLYHTKEPVDTRGKTDVLETKKITLPEPTPEMKIKYRHIKDWKLASKDFVDAQYQDPEGYGKMSFEDFVIRYTQDI